jgi:hypothetical protein
MEDIRLEHACRRDTHRRVAHRGGTAYGAPLLKVKGSVGFIVSNDLFFF